MAAILLGRHQSSTKPLDSEMGYALEWLRWRRP